MINVENFGDGAGGAMTSGADVRKVDLRSGIESRLGAANKTNKPKELRNVGPSISYKLRDAAGQAREFQNYMVPVDTGDGQPVFLLGMRERPEEPFRYLRVPADDQGTMDGFVRMRAALADPALRERAVERYVARRRPIRSGPSWPSSCAPRQRARWRCSPAPSAPGPTP